MGSIHEVMEAFRKAPSNSERATKFEELVVIVDSLAESADG